MTAIKEIAGEVKGERGDHQFRLYLTLAPQAEQILAQSREFFRDKDNTIFHKGYPTNFRQRGHTPTLQFWPETVSACLQIPAAPRLRTRSGARNCLLAKPSRQSTAARPSSRYTSPAHHRMHRFVALFGFDLFQLGNLPLPKFASGGETRLFFSH